MERQRRTTRVLPIASVTTTVLPFRKIRVRIKLVDRPRTVTRVLPLQLPPLPPGVVLVRTPRVTYLWRPQIKNRPAQITSIQNNYIFFRPATRVVHVFSQVKRTVGNLPWLSYVPIAIRQKRFYPVPQEVKRAVRFLMPVVTIQPMLVTKGRSRLYSTPYNVRPSVRRYFSSVTNVTTNVTNIIAPAKKPRAYPVPYVISRRSMAAIAASAVVMLHRVASVRLPYVVKRRPGVMVASTIHDSVVLTANRLKGFSVPVPGRRVVKAVFQPITLNPLVLKKPQTTRQVGALTVVHRKSPVTIQAVAPLVVRLARPRGYSVNVPARRIASVLVSGLVQDFVPLVSRRRLPYQSSLPSQKVVRTLLAPQIVSAMVVARQKVTRFVPQSRIVVRSQPVPLVKSPPIVLRPRQPRSYPVFQSGKRIASVLVSGLVQNFVPLVFNRRLPYAVAPPGQRIHRSLLQSSVVQPLLVAKIKINRNVPISQVVRRHAPFAIAPSPVLAVIRRPRLYPVNVPAKRVPPALVASIQGFPIIARRLRGYPVGSQVRRVSPTIFSPATTVVRSVHRLRQYAASQCRPQRNLLPTTSAPRVLISVKRRVLVAPSQPRRTIAALFVCPQVTIVSQRKLRHVSSLYPVVRRRLGGATTVNSQTVLIGKAGRQRTNIAYYPQKTRAAHALFAQQVMVRSPRVVR